MLNKLLAFIRRYDMIRPGDAVVCAVSGGADSMALLWGLYLLREKLDIRLSAAHFNHGLRGEESDRDEAFVRSFCDGYGIPFVSGRGAVTAGKKGLEAAARDARYGFLKSLPGKIATAHTADDNAETVLMRMVRGTGLKGLGGIAPVNGKLIRPMLSVTRREVCAFLEEYHVEHIEDSSNETDAFLRNRLRHHVMPLLQEENPRLAEKLSSMALLLREDEDALTQKPETRVEALRQMKPAQRRRALSALLEGWGVKEPERGHIALAESLVFSCKPSCEARFPGGVTVCRNYGVLEVKRSAQALDTTELSCPGEVYIPQLHLRVICTPADGIHTQTDCFTVRPVGKILLRPRQTGDAICLKGGTKSLKELFIDRKIPASGRRLIPVIADDRGILGVYGFGPDQNRLDTGIQIRFQKENGSDCCDQ